MLSTLKKAFVASAFVGFAAFPLVSEAALISSMFVPGQNSIQDTDAEYVQDANGNVKTTGSFAMGDVIKSILRWDTVNSATIADTILPPYQFTAYAELKVVNIVDLAPFGQPGLSRLIFGATGALGANVLVNLYERSAPNAANGWNLAVDPASGISRVLGQTLISSIGFGEADDFWGSTVPSVNALNIISAAGEGSAQQANGEFGLSSLFGSLNIQKNGVTSAVDGNQHDIVGNSSIYKRDTGVHGGWLVSSNTSATFNVIPEPGSLALIGIALAGLGGMARRRKQVA